MENTRSFFDRNRILIKGFLIAFLILLMLIPAVFIAHLVQERKARQEQVVEEVSSKWASSQTISGPVLMVPYTYSYKGTDGKDLTSRKILHLLPEHLRISGSVSPEVRKRSLYQVMLYRTALQLEGDFAPARLSALGIDPQTVSWGEARLLMGVTDARGLEDEVHLQWPGGIKKLEAGMPENGALNDGLSVPVGFDPASGAAFSLSLKLRGSSSLSFTPVGNTTEVSIQSTWKHPSFDGKYLPDTSADISTNGFTAHWKILASSRTFPQAWTDNKVDIPSSAFGVKLIQPADGYAKTERSVKYAILFIALTFIIFFFLEILQKHQIHPLQYLLVGFALSIFYTLLLSISEYIGFNPAYAIAVSATVTLIGLYVWSVFRSGKTALGFSTALGGLYGYIYILIQLEDYALLFGSVGLFVILAILMYFSRKIDWYGKGNAPAGSAHTDQ
jgi:inner membrane protein